MRTIVFTGGGTGGHIYPGIAVAQKLQNNADTDVRWIGSSRGNDGRIVEGAGTPFIGIPCGKLRRYFSLQNALDFFKVAAGFFVSLANFLKIKPSLVFSKGGFVAVPPCLAARALGIPVVIHESDLSPGLTTRITARFAKRVLVSYEETGDFFNEAIQKKITVTGNPVREAFYRADARKGRAFLGLPEQKSADEPPIIMVTGGSQGARQINELVREILPRLCERYIVVHQTGSADSERISDSPPARYFPFAYINEQMPDVLAAADIAVTRAGANSLWECAALRKPMILIPLAGSGTRGDQEENARYFERKGLASVLFGEDANPENLLAAIDAARDKKNGADVYSAFAKSNSAQIIGDIIMEVTNEFCRD